MTFSDTCSNIFSVAPVYALLLGGGNVGVVLFSIGLLYLCMSVLILYWIKKQEHLGRMGDHEAVKSVIFPVFVNVMWVNSIINFYIGGIILTVEYPAVNENCNSCLWMYSAIWGAQHFVIEGVALLLMQKGLGVYAARRSLRLAALWGLFTMWVQYISYRFAYAGVGFIRAAWSFALLFFYLTLWKIPMRHLFRRPAAIPYAKVWFLFRLAETICDGMIRFKRSHAVGQCLYTFGPFLIFALFQPYITYKTLLDDSR